MTPLTGLLLGAGASQEYGMPMASEISEMFRRELPADGLRFHNKGAQRVGRGVPDDILEELIVVLARSDMSYENVIGYLETNYLRNAVDRKRGQHYHGLASMLTDVIYKIIYEKHLKIRSTSVTALSYLDGLGKLAHDNLPLWVFSLNHDVVLECAAVKLGIPVNSGFGAREALPLRLPLPSGATTIDVEVLTEDHMRKGLPFIQHGTSGINLIKLHGALDLFTVRDGKDVVRLIPVGHMADAPINSLIVANEVLPHHPSNGVYTTNEIMYLDHMKEVQFLQRTTMSGAFKYSQRKDQVLPKNFLGVFQTMINYVTSLISFGYSFEDVHVNEVIRRWLELTADRRLEIVDPYRNSIPPDLRHLTPQIHLTRLKTGQYLSAL